MTFPSGGPGYPQQGGGGQPYQPAPSTGSFPQSPPPAPSAGSSPDFGLIAALAVTALGLVSYFISFSSDAASLSGVVDYLLVGGLLAALRVLPKGPKALPFAAVLSILGGLVAVSAVVRAPAPLPSIDTVILILGILQMLVAIAAVLLEYGVLKPPAPKPQAPQNPYGQPFGGQPGQQQPQYGQQHQFGQQPPAHQQHQPAPGASGEPSNPFSQPTQFTPPAAGPGGQSTTYAPQQGQFFQQPTPSPEAGQSPSSTSTPPGGFGQQS
jgi:hypothetical protein